MHQGSISRLQGTPTLQGPLTPRITCDRPRWSSRTRTGSGWPCWPGSRAPLWAWLLLWALVVPGAWSFLNEEQEEMLVELHNHYRGQVSPSASAMMPLRWDPSLKLLAEGYAAKCIWNHNPELEDTGENLFAGTGPLDLREAVEKWFLEHLDYDFHNNSCDEEKMCGHYTQMVWADTQRVGCAFHLCNNMEGLDWERVSFLVCNYYPAGNYEGERPYVEGDWCSRCPENLKLCENNLCAADTEEEEEDGKVIEHEQLENQEDEQEVQGEEQEVQEEEQEVQEGEQEVQEEEQDVQEEEQEVQEEEQDVQEEEQEVQEKEQEVLKEEQEVQEEVTAEPFVQTPHFIFIDVNKLTVQPPDTPTVSPTVPQSSSEEEQEDTPPPATSEAPTEPPVTLRAEEEEEEEEEGEVKEEEKREEEKKEEKRKEVSEKEKTVRAVPPKLQQDAGSRCTSSVLLVAPILLLLRM